MRKSLLEYSRQELNTLFQELSQPQFRTRQLREWLVDKYCSDFSKMINLPRQLREILSSQYQAYPLEISTIQRSKDKNTIKFAAGTLDNQIIEVVLLKYSYGYSVCLSTQIGCAMGCVFCASARGGLVRNCTANEMLAQVLLAEQLVGGRIGRVVLMGMGEPLLNYDQVVEFLRLCQDQDFGLGLGLRHVTISTCGIVPKIKQLAHERMPVTLALSLHAPNDHIRKKILPVAQNYSLDEVLDACRYFFQKTDRRVSCEYILIKDVNDSRSCAKQLAELLKNEQMHINLIPYNPVDFLDWQAPSRKQIELFADILRKAKLAVTVRRQLGNDIDAACGQLRRREQ